MKVGIITYQTNHLKTQQVFEGLIKNYPDDEYIFYGLPFVKRAERKVFLAHRPDMSAGMDSRELAKKYGCEYVVCNSDLDIDDRCDMYLILGAGILSEKCIKGKKILNEHPGIIPTSRGLDAYKWAIYNLEPVGNTLHYIDASVDSGEIIAVICTPVLKDDTLQDFAMRHYKCEIDMMINYKRYLSAPINEKTNAPEREPHMRMRLETEKELSNKFEQYKKYYAI